MKLTVQKIDDRLAVLLPDDVAAELALREGDAVTVAKAGGVVEAAPNLSSDDILERARKIAERYPETLAALAK